VLAAIGVGAGETVTPLRIDKPLVASWDFDEPSGTTCRDASGNEHHASPERAPAGFDRVAGVFGGALSFSPSHVLHVPGKPNLDGLGKVSFSVWCMPTGKDRYKELFRKEDGDKRVLFSFQENFAVLSLGLNVGGYVECDARITPAQVLDNQWHHCAAAFDGKFMRVYLDGKEIGALERPGVIQAGGPAAGCIGSMNDAECFEGLMDELRIYRDALTADEIAQLHQNGRQALARFSVDVEKQLATLYTPGKTFAETLAGCRKNVAERGGGVNPQIAQALQAKLRAAFPKECDDFAKWTGATAAQYLAARGDDFHHRTVCRLADLLLEYVPLTEQQWKRQPIEDRAKWKELEAVRAKFEKLKAEGAAARYSPAWIELVFEAGPRIQYRPRTQEAVAPYVTPQTPETRNLTAAEAREALERDWLHQAGQKPAPDRIRDEIKWTRRLAERLQRDHNAGFADELTRLAELEKQAAAITAPDRDFYFRVRELKRAIALKNPVVDFNKLLFVDMPYPQGSEWNHETRHRLGYMAVPGARLLILEGLSPDGKLRQLMPQAPLHGSFWRPDVSFDARKVLFCFKPHNEKSFHLYEINADGTGFTQLTDGIYDDLDPIYLPDGHILFSTTRAHTYVRCMPPTNAFVLARCDGDGRNVYLVSPNNEPDYLPSVMDDGRVVYTRWEYTDKPVWRLQKLWTINPDGTQVSMFWGNQSVWPDLVKDARNIPGTRRVMVTGSAHHNWFAGSVGIIDPTQGLNFPQGLTKVTADVAWPECGNGPVDPIECRDYHRSGDYPAYYSPYPLGEQDFLVSAQRGGKFVLYLMDIEGNRELIYEGVNHIFHAMPLKARARPPVLADRVAWPDRDKRLTPQHGVIYSNNVYQGAPPELRNKARFLRVWQIDPKTYTYWYKRPYVSTGPVVSMVQSEGVKRLLGTVPIEADGSVAFNAPPGKALHFQLLDADGRALQTMRSFVGVMPGEYRGCLGCHESHSRAPALSSSPPAAGRGQGEGCAALTKSPRDITPPPWPDDTVSYPRYVKPVLDKYCGKCHQGDGEGRKTLDLTDRPNFLGFSEVYALLIGHPTWGKPYQKPPKPPPGFGIADMLMVEGYGQTDPAAYGTPPPMTALSYKSRLVERCASGTHHDVKVDPISLQRIIAWVDAMCPYRGDEEVRALDDPEFQGVDWLAIRPRIKTAPQPVRPGPVE
jgi:hypothetical protein